MREPTGSELEEEEKGRSTGRAGDISLNPMQDGCGSRDTHQSPETTCAPGRTPGQQVGLGLLTSQVLWSPELLALPNLGPQTQRTTQGSAGPPLSCCPGDQGARRGSAGAGEAGTLSALAEKRAISVANVPQFEILGISLPQRCKLPDVESVTKKMWCVGGTGR